MCGREKTQVEEYKVGIEAEVGFDLFGFIKSKLKTDANMREEIKTKFSRNPRELINKYCDKLAFHAAKQQDLPPDNEYEKSLEIT